MAHGKIPEDAIVEYPAGLWKVPRWAGIEILPAAIIICVEVLAFFLHTTIFSVIAAVAGFAWWYILSQLFLRDERFLRIFLKTRPFHTLEYLRADAIVSTPHERLNEVLR